MNSLTVVETNRMLSNEAFQRLSEIPLELEWLANIENAKTKRAYKVDVGEFVTFVGIKSPEELRLSHPRPCHCMAGYSEGTREL